MNKEQKQELTEIYHKYFNGSMIDFLDSIYEGEKSNYIKLYLAKDITELAQGYKDNDIFTIHFNITEKSDNNFNFRSLSNSYRIKTKNQYLYCDYEKITAKKINGNFDTIKTHFKKFIQKLAKSLYLNYKAENLLKNDILLAKQNLNFKEIEKL